MANQVGNAAAAVADVDARPPIQAGNAEFVVRTITPFGSPEKVLKLGGAVTGSHAGKRWTGYWRPLRMCLLGQPKILKAFPPRWLCILST